MCSASRIAHCGELVADRIVELLKDFLGPEMAPFTVRLGDEVVKVSYVTGLLQVEFGIVQGINFRLF